MKIRVKNPDGQYGYIPEDQINSALENGYSLANSFERPSISGEPAKNPEHPGRNLALEDILPTAGGIAGGILGGAAALPTGGGVPFGGTLGATIGGQFGSSMRNAVRLARGKEVPTDVGQSLSETGMEGLKQGASFLAGSGLAKGIGVVGRTIGRRIGDIEGLMTGTGGAVRKAGEAGLEGGEAQKALISAMRGNISEKQVANDALDALQEIRKARSVEYTKKLNEIYRSSFQKKIDLTPIKTELDDLLNSYNIGRSPKGDLDFSRAALDDASATDVKRIASLVDDWGSQAGDNTVKGLDILKRRIDDFYSPSSEARAFVTSLRNKVKSTLVDEVPKYKELTAGYQKASDVIHDISSELSLGSSSKAGTIVRKLQQSLRQNFDLRKEFVETLDKIGNKNLLEKVAGSELDPWMPKGLMRGVAGGMGMGAFWNPKILGGLPFISPRTVGEAALKVGQTARLISPIKTIIPQLTQAEIGRRRLPFLPDEQNQ